MEPELALDIESGAEAAAYEALAAQLDKNGSCVPELAYLDPSTPLPLYGYLGAEAAALQRVLTAAEPAPAGFRSGLLSGLDALGHFGFDLLGHLAIGWSSEDFYVPLG